MEFARYRKSRCKTLFEQFYVVGINQQELEELVIYDGSEEVETKVTEGETKTPVSSKYKEENTQDEKYLSA